MVGRPKEPERPAQKLAAPSSTVDDALPLVDVRAIVGGGREAVIVHNGDRYRLRITANDKLILTK